MRNMCSGDVYDTRVEVRYRKHWCSVIWRLGKIISFKGEYLGVLVNCHVHPCESRMNSAVRGLQSAHGPFHSEFHLGKTF